MSTTTHNKRKISDDNNEQQVKTENQDEPIEKKMKVENDQIDEEEEEISTYSAHSHLADLQR